MMETKHAAIEICPKFKVSQVLYSVLLVLALVLELFPSGYLRG
jgi:hypothetical protein